RIGAPVFIHLRQRGVVPDRLVEQRQLRRVDDLADFIATGLQRGRTISLTRQLDDRRRRIGIEFHLQGRLRDRGIALRRNQTFVGGVDLWIKLPVGVQLDFACEYRRRVHHLALDTQHRPNFLLLLFGVVDDVGKRAAYAALGKLHLNRPGID